MSLILTVVYEFDPDLDAWRESNGYTTLDEIAADLEDNDPLDVLEQLDNAEAAGHPGIRRTVWTVGIHGG